MEEEGEWRALSLENKKLCSRAEQKRRGVEWGGSADLHMAEGRKQQGVGKRGGCRRRVDPDTGSGSGEIASNISELLWRHEE